MDISFPKEAIIAMIKRNDKYLMPRGSAVIEPDDILQILSDNQEGMDKVNDCLSKKTLPKKN